MAGPVPPEFQPLVDQVHRTVDAQAAAVIAYQGVSQRLKDALATRDFSVIQEEIDLLDQSTQALAAATVAGTPADPNAPPTATVTGDGSPQPPNP